MDLNEKIAARRRELVVEQEKAKQEEIETTAKLAAERSEAIGVEVNTRLAELGIELPNQQKSHISIDKKSVDKEVENILNNAAYDRMTAGEKTFGVILLFAGFVFIFIAWPVGIALILWAGFYGGRKRVKYKKQIIEEGKAKMNQS
jgi:hypothetical protein